MAERERGPEPDGDDRPGGMGNPTDPVTARSDGVPRQFPADPVVVPGFSPAGISENSRVRLAQRRGRQTADLRQKLDEKAAATDELREALDELRQVLDVDNPPPTTTGRRRGRFLVPLVILLVVAMLALWMFLDHDSGRIVAGEQPAAGSVPVTGRTTAGAPAPTITIRPLPWPGGAVATPPGLTTTGPGAQTPGTDVQVAVDPDGVHLDVFERLLLESPTADPLAIAAPTLPALSATARVQDLQVQLDDTAVAVDPDGPASWTATPPAGDTYTRVVLRYRMTGALALVTPAAPGRALGIVTPLTGMISSGHGHAVQVRTADQAVLGVSCPTAPRGAVCGVRSGAGWVATIPGDALPMVVLLQLNTRRG